MKTTKAYKIWFIALAVIAILGFGGYLLFSILATNLVKTLT